MRNPDVKTNISILLTYIFCPYFQTINFEENETSKTIQRHITRLHCFNILAQTCKIYKTINLKLLKFWLQICKIEKYVKFHLGLGLTSDKCWYDCLSTITFNSHTDSVKLNRKNKGGPINIQGGLLLKVRLAEAAS